MMHLRAVRAPKNFKQEKGCTQNLLASPSHHPAVPADFSTICYDFETLFMTCIPARYLFALVQAGARRHMEELNRVNRTYRIKKQVIESLTDDVMMKADCKSQNEFVNDAISFYVSFLKSEELDSFISRTLLAEMNGKIRLASDDVKEVLFKLAVLSYACIYVRVVEGFLTPESFDAVIRKSVEDVKGLNGYIDFPKMFRSIRW